PVVDDGNQAIAANPVGVAHAAGVDSAHRGAVWYVEQDATPTNVAFAHTVVISFNAGVSRPGKLTLKLCKWRAARVNGHFCCVALHIFEEAIEVGSIFTHAL